MYYISVDRTIEHGYLIRQTAMSSNMTETGWPSHINHNLALHTVHTSEWNTQKRNRFVIYDDCFVHMTETTIRGATLEHAKCLASNIMRFFLSACACKLLWLDLTWRDKAHTYVHLRKRKKALRTRKKRRRASTKCRRVFSLKFERH